MRTNDLIEVLDNFVSSDNNKSILIDGPWGCGKTHQIRDFIDKHKSIKIVYLSLFGHKSIESINAAIYQQTSVVKNFFLNTVKVVPSILNSVPIVKDYVPAIDLQLNINKNIKRESIIIFDDLERIGEDVSYSDLFGYINTLFGCGCKVMCCVSSGNINDKDKKNQFEEFKEKVFDCYFLINETNREIFNLIFEQYQIPYLESLYDLFDNNIRKALKTKYHFDALLKRLEENNTSFDNVPHSKTILLIATIYTILIAFGRFSVPDKTLENPLYIKIKEEYNDNIANNYFHYVGSKRFGSYAETKGFKNLMLAVLKSFVFMDYSSFDEIMLNNTEDNTISILDKTYYYLSDQGKEDYYKSFLDSLTNKTFDWDEKGKNIIRNLMEDDVVIDDEYISLIADAVIASGEKEVPNLGYEFGLIGRVNLNDSEKHLVATLDDDISERLISERIKEFEDMYHNKAYGKLALYLDSLGNANTGVKRSFKDNVVKNDFYIPDITEEINEDIWSYCHSMARYCELNELEEEFIEFAKTQCKKYKGNKSLVDRYHALIFYSLHREDVTEESLLSDTVPF